MGLSCTYFKGGSKPNDVAITSNSFISIGHQNSAFTTFWVGDCQILAEI